MTNLIGTLLTAAALLIFAAPGAYAQDEGPKKDKKPRIERRKDKEKGGKKKHKKGHKKHCKKNRR